jgi:hypothetical protein
LKILFAIGISSQENRALNSDVVRVQCQHTRRAEKLAAVALEIAPDSRPGEIYSFISPESFAQKDALIRDQVLSLKGIYARVD